MHLATKSKFASKKAFTTVRDKHKRVMNPIFLPEIPYTRVARSVVELIETISAAKIIEIEIAPVYEDFRRTTKVHFELMIPKVTTEETISATNFGKLTGSALNGVIISEVTIRPTRKVRFAACLVE
jgi:hypothetical protein